MVKKYGFLVVLILVVTGLLFALVNRSKLYDYLSGEMQQQTSAREKFQAEEFIRKNFDYSQNGGDFECTLLEFKSGGCTICKQMEPVIEEIRNWKDTKVNVQVIQVMNANSQELLKYYGVSAVPTLIVLNSKSDEVSRKYGFITSDELKQKIRNSQ